MADMKELKSCPLCGSDNVGVVSSAAYRVKCFACYTSGSFGDNEEAIKAWNTRAPSEQLTQTQQALDSALEANKVMMDRLELTEEVSEDIADYVCAHIQQMYPDAWKLIGSSAKRSIKGSITNAWNFHVNQVKPKAALKAIEG